MFVRSIKLPKRLNNRGDTIMEVLIAVAVLSLILVTSFALANRSSQANRQANERGEASKYVSAEVEKLKYYLGTPGTDEPDADGNFHCLVKDPADPTGKKYELVSNVDVGTDIDANFRLANAKCKQGTDGRYTVVFSRGANHTYSVYGRWDNVTGKNVDKINAVHRLYPNIESGLAIGSADPGSPGGGGGPIILPGPPSFHLRGEGTAINGSGAGNMTCTAVDMNDPLDPRSCSPITPTYRALYACVSFKARYERGASSNWGNDADNTNYSNVRIRYSNADCGYPDGRNGPAGFFDGAMSWYTYSVRVCINDEANCTNPSLGVPSGGENEGYYNVNISSLNVRSISNIWIEWVNDVWSPYDANFKLISFEVN